MLKGSTTTLAGIIVILAGAAVLIVQGVQGKPINATDAAAPLGLIATGVGLIKAADQKQ